MTHSENQVKQFFAVKAYKASAVTSTDAVGTVSVHSNTDGDVYFLYKGVNGVMRSDLIKKTSLTYGKATPASTLARGLQKYIVALDGNVNSGAPLAGQNYILRNTFFQNIGLSYDDQYFKYGEVQATTGMTAEAFYLAMIASLNANFAKEVAPLLTFSMNGVKASVTMSTNAGITVTAVNAGTAANSYTFAIASVSAGTASITVNGNAISASLTAAAKTIADLKALVASSSTASARITITGTDATTVVAEATPVTLTGGTATGILVEEVEQKWVLGRMEGRRLFFKIQPGLITVSGDELVWGTVTATSATTTIPNGKIVADMEYFFMGERGDIYRNIGFPNSINTQYIVDPTLEYNLFDIGYYFKGTNEAIQESNKGITLSFVHAGANLAAKVALANSVISAFNTAAGTSYSTLPTS